MRRIGWILFFAAYLAVIALSAHRPAKAQGLVLMQPLGVEYDPDGWDLYRDPDTAIDCIPRQGGVPLACAFARWPDQDDAQVGVPHLAEVDHAITLRGPTTTIEFAPMVRCVVHDGRNRYAIGIPQPTCASVRPDGNHRLEWAIGGQAPEGLAAPPGLYRGSLTLSITQRRQTNRVLVPVTYEVFGMRESCSVTFTGGGTISFGEIPTGVASSVTLSEDSTVSYGSEIEDEMLTNPNYTGDRILGNEFRFVPYGGTQWVDINMQVTAPTGLVSGSNTMTFAPSAWYRYRTGDPWTSISLTGGLGTMPRPSFNAATGYLRVGGTASWGADVDTGTYTGTFVIQYTCV